jgi:transposase
VYVDETGMDQYVYREHARSPRGEKAYGTVSGRKFKRISIVAGKCDGRIIAPMEYGGTTDSALFEHWFEHYLLKAIPTGSVIVMDNATFHRKSVLRSMAEGTGASLLFLPPYSPDLNPIELFWSRLYCICFRNRIFYIRGELKWLKQQT